MAIAETARLATVLTLDDKLSPGLAKPVAAVKKFEGSASRAGAHVATLGKTMAKAGVIAGGALAGGLLLAVRSGLGDLATLETATTSVTGAIKQMGLSGEVTAAQVATWANDIESDIGAAFDDKDITAATANLIRFGKVAPQNLKPAMVVMTDLAVKTGSVDSASRLLGKALADPTKAAGALRKAGVILTDQQEKQIKAFVKAGEVGKAQKVILDALTKTTKGAAAASQGPYARALNVLADASEDAKKALAEGFLPVIERVAGKLSKVLADPKAIQSIRDLGKGLANAFDDAVTFAEGIDWKSVGDGLKAAAGFTKRLVDAFAAMPPEAKGLLLAAAGLTKLTGGAPIKFVVDIAKESLSSAFGHFFDRGSSPANPLFVTGTGLGGGAGGPGAGGTTGALGKVSKVIGGALIVGAVAELADAIQPLVTGAGTDLHNAIVDAFDIKINLPIPKPSELEWPFGPKNTPTILPDIFGGNGILGGSAAGQSNPQTSGDLGRHGPMPVVDKLTTSRIAHLANLQERLEHAKDAHDSGRAARLQAKIDALKAKMGHEGSAQRQSLAGIKAKQQASIVAFRAGERATHTVGAKVQRSTAAMNDVRHSVNAVRGTTASKLNTANAKLDAIRHKKMHFTTKVSVHAQTSVSVRNVNNSNRTTNRYSSKVLNQVS